MATITLSLNHFIDDTESLRLGPRNPGQNNVRGVFSSTLISEIERKQHEKSELVQRTYKYSATVWFVAIYPQVELEDVRISLLPFLFLLSADF